MSTWFKKLIEKHTGIEAERKRLEEEQERLAAEAEAERKRLEEAELELLKKKNPKAYATRKGEPWVSVLDVKVNKDNVRNGFFEMDWNEHFIKELRLAGYGLEADPEEEIVDRWFRDIVFNMLQEEGLDTTRNSGYINVTPIDKGRSSVS